MKRLVTAGLAGIAALAIAACGSANASTATGPASPTPGGRGLRGAAGQLVQISGANLIVSGANGDTTVTYSGSTVVTQTQTETVASITTGECIVATGTKQPGGAIAIDTVRLSQPVNASCSAGFGLGGGTRPSPRAGVTPPPQFANRASVRGTVTSVSGTSVTVQPATGSPQSISIPTTVAVSALQTVTASSLQTGQCVLAAGPRSSSGTVTARTITIVPAGPSGCFTGRGAFGGGGFPGAGFGGGGVT